MKLKSASITSSRRYSPVLDLLACGAVSCVTGAVLCLNARRWFDFFDMSSFMDSGYRVLSGQKPYRDFFYHAGPIHPYLHALFFKIFGFNQMAVLGHLAFINTAVVGLTYLLARSRFNVVTSAFFSALCVLCFLGPVSHPWYDQNSMLFVLVALVLVDKASYSKKLRKAGSFPIPFVCGVFISLSFFTKSNIGAAAAAIFVTYFFVFRGWRQAIFLKIGGLAATILIFTFLASPSDFFWQTIKTYSPGHRLTDFNRLFDVALTLPYGALAAAILFLVALGGKPYLVRNRERLFLTASFFALSLFAGWTGSMMPPVNIFLLGVVTLLLLMTATRIPRPRRIAERHRILNASRVVAVLLIAVIFVAGVKMTRTLVAWQWRGYPLVSDYTFRNENFKGWRSEPKIGRGVDAVVDYAKKYIPQRDSILVFPDATLIYGLTGHASYKLSPIFYQTPSPEKGATLGGPTLVAFKSHLAQQPPDWIIIHHQTEVPFFDTDRLIAWLGISRWLTVNYRTAWAKNDFTIYHNINAENLISNPLGAK